MAKRKARERSARIPDPVDSPENGADELATEVWKGWRESQDHLTKWREAAAESYDFIAGVQWTDEEVRLLTDQLRPVITFNRVAPVINAVLGYEINSRQAVTYLPRTIEDTGPAQVETEAASYFREACDAEDEETDQFNDALVCGLGWTEHRIDYDENPEGMLDVDRVDPMEMGYEPSAIRRNLSDAKRIYRGRWIDKKRAKEMWPDHDFDGADTMHNPREDADVNEPIQVPENAWYKSNAVGSQYQRRRGKVFILEMQYFERKAFYSAINPQSGQMEDISSEAHTKLQKMLKDTGLPPLQSVKRTKKEFRRCFVHGPTTLEDGVSPCPDRFTYQCITGFRDRNRNLWFGLVQAMKDPQRWANKWLSQQLHLINSNAKGRTWYEDGAFENQAQVEKDMAKPGAVMKIEAGFFEKVKTEPPVQLPNNSFQLMEYAIASVRDTTGVNVELLGLADRDQPGILEQQRKQSAMAILAPLFDAKRHYMKEAGRLTLFFIQKYLSDGRLIRIVGDGQAKYVPLTKRPDFVEYDVIVDESPTSPNMKEQTFGVLMQVLPGIMKTGVPVPPDLLDYIPGLPAELVEKWKAQIEEAKQSQAQQVPPEVQKMQAEIAMKQQMAAHDAQVTQQKAQMDALHNQQKLQASIDETRARAAADIEIKRMQAAADMEIEQRKAQQQMEIQRQQAELQMLLNAQTAKAKQDAMKSEGADA